MKPFSYIRSTPEFVKDNLESLIDDMAKTHKIIRIIGVKNSACLINLEDLIKINKIIFFPKK